MFKLIRKIYEKPTADSIAYNELEEAKRQLLAQQAASEYHQKMTEYYEDKIARLTRYTLPKRSMLNG